MDDSIKIKTVELDGAANKASYLRTEIKRIGDIAKILIKEARLFTPIEGVDLGEVNANAMLAYRALEDAAMRYGKMIQAIEGGNSIYDNNDAQRVATGPVPAGTYGKDDTIEKGNSAEAN